MGHIGVCIAILIVVAIGCCIWHFHSIAPYKQEAIETEIETAKMVQREYTAKLSENTELEQWEHESTEIPSAAKETDIQYSADIDEQDIYVPITTSSNPMFSDGVPIHLQCRNEWVGLYLHDFEGDLYQLKCEVWARVDEILSKYNPHRPIADIWPSFIEAQKSYAANVDPKMSNIDLSQNRLDWLYQGYIDFPEIFVLNQFTLDQVDVLRDVDHFDTMRLVDIGEFEPDINLHILQDGRKFRARTGYNYKEINKRTYLDKNLRLTTSGITIGFGHSDKNSEVIEIILADTSDDQLEQLGGWDYNINPYSNGMYVLPKNATERVLQINRNKYGGFRNE